MHCREGRPLRSAPLESRPPSRGAYWAAQRPERQATHLRKLQAQAVTVALQQQRAAERLLDASERTLRLALFRPPRRHLRGGRVALTRHARRHQPGRARCAEFLGPLRRAQLFAHARDLIGRDQLGAADRGAHAGGEAGELAL